MRLFFCQRIQRKGGGGSTLKRDHTQREDEEDQRVGMGTRRSPSFADAISKDSKDPMYFSSSSFYQVPRRTDNSSS